MNKPILLSFLSSCIALAACSDKSLDRPDAGSAEDVNSPIVSFFIAKSEDQESILSVPNDISFGADSVLSQLAIGAQLDSQLALSQLDGWSVTAPFVIGVQFDEETNFNTAIDVNTLQQADSVVIFECPVGSSVRQLEPAPLPCDPSSADKLNFNVDYALNATDDGIVVTPLKPFAANTGYFYGVSNAITDTFGQALTRSKDFNDFSTAPSTASLGPLAPIADLIQGTNKLLQLKTGLAPEDFVYSATFTTQDVDVVAKLAMDRVLSTAAFSVTPVDTGITVADILGITADESGPELFGAASLIKLYRGKLSLPYFLPFPGLKGLDIAEPDSEIPNPELIKAYPNCKLADIQSPCGYWLDSSFKAPTNQSTALFEIPNPLMPGQVEVDLYIPTDSLAPSGAKVVQYVHGFGDTKASAAAYALKAATQGLIVAAIDQPLHGSRSFDAPTIDSTTGQRGPGDGIYELTATRPGTQDIPADADKDVYQNGSPIVFANIASLLTIRDNLRQAATDQLSLKRALSQADLASMTGYPVENGNIAITGLSLGGIVAAVAQGMSEIQEDTSLKFSASTLSVPGAQLGAVFAYSEEFGETLKFAFAASADFSASIANAISFPVDRMWLIQAATGDPLGTEALERLPNINTAEAARAELDGIDQGTAFSEYLSLINLAYPTFLQQFINGGSAVIDAGDPSIWLTKSKATPTLVHQVIGDKVVPNSTTLNGYPLGGTEGLIKAFGISKTTESIDNGDTIRTYVNFVGGQHASFLAPDPVEVTQEMQSQFIEFILTDGKQLTINDSSVIEP